MNPTPDLPLSDALRFVRDAVQAEFVALRVARDTVIRTAPTNGPIQPAVANIDERVFQLHGALLVLEKLVTTTLEQRARAGEAGRFEREYRDDDGEHLCAVCGKHLGADAEVLACGLWAHASCMPWKAPTQDQRPPTHPDLWASDVGAGTCRNVLADVLAKALALTRVKQQTVLEALASEEARKAFALLFRCGPMPSPAVEDDIPF